MREIKFRALVPVNQNGPKTIEFFDLSKIDDCNRLSYADYDVNQLMQFTGLKDKNNVEIYEGDICRILYTDWISKSDNDPRTLEQYLIDIASIGRVIYIDCGFVIDLGEDKYGYRIYGSLDPGTHGYIEKIGNIHQNPELLK